MDKVAHAFNAFLLCDILYWRMTRKTGRSTKSALASSAIAVGLDLYAELFDAFEERTGFSFGDVGFNAAGAAFSYADNTVPGLKEKLISSFWSIRTEISIRSATRKSISVSNGICSR